MRKKLPIVLSFLTFTFLVTSFASKEADSESINTQHIPTTVTETSNPATLSQNTPDGDKQTEKKPSPSPKQPTISHKDQPTKVTITDQDHKAIHKTSKPIASNIKKSNPSKASSNKKTTLASSMQAVEQEVVRLVNIERKKAGLKPLIGDSQISSVARKKSQDMCDNNYFDHQSPTYGSPFDMLKKFGISYHTAGENIAAGQTTAAKVMDSWMNSPGHRANILNPNFTRIGVGFVKGGSYATYWTQQFTG